MIQVKLMGELGEKFGTDWESHDNNLRDILAMINCQADGFAEYLAENFHKDIGLEVVHGDQLLIETEDDMPNYSLPMIKNTIYLTPVPAGAGFGKVFKIIVGVFLIVTGLYWLPEALMAMNTAAGLMGGGVVFSETFIAIASYAVAAMGGLLALRGLVELMTPQTPGNSPESYLFGNSQENIKMGHPVPLLYGELIVPGVPINFGYVDQKLTSVPYGYTRTGKNNSTQFTTNNPSNSWGDGGGSGGSNDEDLDFVSEE